MRRQTGEIQKAFDTARSEGRAALVIYTTGGHPTIREGLETLLTLADAGADVIELGIPFSDPLADGPTIQKSSFEAIEQGVDLSCCLALLRQFREQRETPIVLFSYLNPIMDYGVDRFLADAVDAGADGLLLTDLPVDADSALERKIESSPLDLVRLIAPTTTPERAKHIASRSQGFAYYISRTGVTGAGHSLSAGLSSEVTALRSVAQLPVAVGFGISTPEQAATVAAVADGVIVGSAVVAVLATEGVAAAGELVRSLREGVESVAVVGK